jgi:hypothetical protein
LAKQTINYRHSIESGLRSYGNCLTKPKSLSRPKHYDVKAIQRSMPIHTRNKVAVMAKKVTFFLGGFVGSKPTNGIASGPLSSRGLDCEALWE